MASGGLAGCALREGAVVSRLDLSSAQAVQFGSSDVDKVRLNSVDRWTLSPPETITHTIFNGAPLTLGSYTDGGAGSWMAQQFIRSAGPDWEVEAIGIFVPIGSQLIGSRGSVGAMFKDVGFVSGLAYVNEAKTNELFTPMDRDLVAGWNWYELVQPWPWTMDNSHMLAAYTLDGGYLYDGSNLPSGDIAATDGSSFVLSGSGAAGSVYRCWYDSGALSETTFRDSESRSYGLDIRVREV